MTGDPCSCGEVHALRAELETTRAARDEAKLRAQATERRVDRLRDGLSALLRRVDDLHSSIDAPELTDVG